MLVLREATGRQLLCLYCLCRSTSAANERIDRHHSDLVWLAAVAAVGFAALFVLNGRRYL